ncbi:MAG TPA: CRTAC1 family protein [Planctomycetota bacterium]|nr:CRTAC1 family protein [Planctomycetota bacterium]
MILAGLALLAAEGAAYADISQVAVGALELVCGGASKDWIVEVNGGGLALEDLNGDGALDLIVVEGSTIERLRAKEVGPPPRVLLGRGDGSFALAPETWSMAGLTWGTGVALGDVDGDGWCDVCLASLGGLVLYRNLAGQGLERVEDAGLAGAGWFTSCVFFDADGNGTLDLYAARYLDFDLDKVPVRGTQGAQWKGKPVLFGPEGLEAESDRLYLGKGDGTFVDGSVEAGLESVPAAFGLGVVCQDFDLDGRPDLYVSNDSTPNHLWHNLGEGRFKEVGFAMGLSHGPEGREQAGMGIAVGQVGSDAIPSVFVTNFSGESNVLYRPSRRPGRFRERAASLGLAQTSRQRLGWGTGFTDWNRDGRADLWVLNGHVYPEADAPGTDTNYAQPDQLFVQKADGSFVEQPLFGGKDRVTRAGVAGDIDGDGDEDLVAWTMEGGLLVLRNDAPDPGSWIGLWLHQAGPNPDGIGARVEVEREGHIQRFQVQRSAGFQASRPARLVVGLGEGREPVIVRVRWPGQDESKEYRLEPGRYHRVQRDE